MAYKKYTIKLRDAIGVRSSTDGFQPKFLVESNRKFIKVQCELQKTLRDDWRVEDIATRICKQLGIPCIEQTPCRVDIITNKIVKQRLGVISDNFETYGYNFVSFQRLLERFNDSETQKYSLLTTNDKIRFIVDCIHYVTKIPKINILHYVYNMVTIDLLVLNQDRHFKNFGVFYDNNSNCYQIWKLFDFGMGLFENDTVYDDLKDLKECLRYSYIEPFGEDPIDLVRQLKENATYRNYLKTLRIKDLNISKNLFIHPASYEYFLRMKRELIL